MHRFNDLADFSREQIKDLLGLAARLQQHPQPRALEGKVLSLLFLSPSLRTLSSFQSAMMRLGGGCRDLARAWHVAWRRAPASSWTAPRPSTCAKRCR